MKTNSAKPQEPEESDITQHSLNRRTFISFGVLAGMYGIGYMGWRFLYKAPLDNGLIGGIQEPLRPVLEANEKIFKTVYSQTKLVETYPAARGVENPRVNGAIGLEEEIDAEWKLEVKRADGRQFSVSVDELRRLPKEEITFDFKCIEGWNEISRWGGVMFSVFMKHYSLTAEAAMHYIGLSTPADEYYVGIDMKSALHPQTLICYEMNGKPLTQQHGAPLRLIIPVKYGVKHLKRIGTLVFSNERPPDYWAERGYDYYLGL